MRLLLIRHGETVDNVAGLYAGVTDSPLTNHGVAQVKRLGADLVDRHTVTHVFSSDLQRAFKTAKAITQAFEEKHHRVLELYQLKILQEQDFGSFEKMAFAARAKVEEEGSAPLVQPETKESMRARANQFLDDFLIPLLHSEDNSEQLTVAVVSHGLLLATLWRCLLRRFEDESINIGPGVELPVGFMSLEHLGSWSNTGYMEIGITNKLPSITDRDVRTIEAPEVLNAYQGPVPMLSGYKMSLLGVNRKDHLQGLKRTGGGVGSSKHDEAQKSIHSFFKKQRTEK